MKSTVLFILLLSFSSLAAQSDSSRWQKKLEQFKLQPILGFQMWGTYTHGAELFNSTTQQYESVDDRFNAQIHRTRLGVKGQPYPHLKFNLTAALDFVGRDQLSAVEAGANNGAGPRFNIWHAFLQWKLSANNEAANLVFGYFTPMIGREALSSALRSPSMEKAWSQNYLRRHLVGTGPGRAAGINLGGLLNKKDSDSKFQFGYDIGVFNTTFQNFSGNSSGTKWSPLVVSRLVLYFGDPELSQYGIGHKFNYFGKRKGLSLAFSGATQGETDLFLNNQAAGMDVLFNWGKFNFDAEWTYLWRTGNTNNEEFTLSSSTGYLRLGYNINLKKGYVLEPLLNWVQFNGVTSLKEQNQAAAVGALSGTDSYMDIGFNFYFNPDLKISLHYTLRDGDAGDMGAGFTGNNYFTQGGLVIRRGSWLGLGLVAIL